MLDHNAKSMRIYKTNDPKSSFHPFKYSEIIDVKCEEIKLEDKRALHERFSFKFELYTSKRPFILYASSMDEKLMWYHTFKWIVEMNQFSK